MENNKNVGVYLPCDFPCDSFSIASVGSYYGCVLHFHSSNKASIFFSRGLGLASAVYEIDIHLAFHASVVDAAVGVPSPVGAAVGVPSPVSSLVAHNT